MRACCLVFSRPILTSTLMNNLKLGFIRFICVWLSVHECLFLYILVVSGENRVHYLAARNGMIFSVFCPDCPSYFNTALLHFVVGQRQESMCICVYYVCYKTNARRGRGCWGGRGLTVGRQMGQRGGG